MSFDSTDDEYHLTPHGWVDGTHYFYGHAEKVVDRPKDSVITLVRHMRQSYGSAPEHIEWECIWKSPDYSESERKAFEDKYPRPNH
jgi:hypothetical protein